MEGIRSKIRKITQIHSAFFCREYVYLFSVALRRLCPVVRNNLIRKPYFTILSL